MSVCHKKRLPSHPHLATDIIGCAIPLSQRTDTALTIIWEIINNAPNLTNQAILDYIWGYDVNGVWLPKNLTIPTGGNQLRFKDALTNGYFDVSLLTSKDENDNPILAFAQGIVAKKDLTCGGFLGANQGYLFLGSGLSWRLDDPTIQLMHSGTRKASIVAAFKHQSSPPTGLGEDDAGYCYVNTNDHHVYMWTGSSWIDKGHEDSYTDYFNILYIKGADGSAGHIHCGNVGMDSSTPMINFYINNAHKLMLGHDSVNAFLSAVAGDLVFAATGLNIRPASDDTYNLGTDSFRYKEVRCVNIHADNYDNLPIIPYWQTSFADQNLLQSSDAIFNSVKGTSSSGALKGGNEFTVAWDATWTKIVSHNKHIKLVTPTNKAIEFNSGGNVAFNIAGTYITVYGSKVFCPDSNNQGNIGGDGSLAPYWGAVYANYLKWKTSCTQFDALDDLNLVKNYKSKKEMRNGIEIDVIDMETSFPFLVDEHGFKESAQIEGFLLGCIKKLVLEKESQAERIDALEQRLATLEKKVAG